jgi:purine-nucleoside phosphorylase
MPTPHISAAAGDFAPAVLMPGDPKRAERMARSILAEPRLVSDVRGIQGFTGTVAAGPHAGRALSVMASGMGMPSMGIYATELFKFYGVERIVRVGTAGGVADRVDIGDVLIATGAHTTSSMNELRIPGTHFSAVADLAMAAAALAAAGNRRVFAGTVISADHFYCAIPGQVEALARHGVLGVEMESAALYGIAAEYGRGALTVLTVSDHLVKDSRDMTSEERETIFQGAVELALAAALA